MTVTNYATGDDFLQRYDARLIGDLVRDDGSQEPPESLPVNENLLAALDDAFGEIMTAIMVGDRYTLAQLDNSALNENALAFLRRLTCDLAFILIHQRRGKLDDKKHAGLIKKNEQRLKSLQDGANVLVGVNDANAQASVIGMAQPQLIPISQRPTIRNRTYNYYPIPFQEKPYTSGGN